MFYKEIKKNLEKMIVLKNINVTRNFFLLNYFMNNQDTD